MNGDVGIWDKLSKMVVFLLLVAVAVAVGFWYLPVIQQNERFRKEIYRLETQIKQGEETSKQLRVKIEAMSTDRQTVERTARETLGYAKPDETVVRFENAATNAPPRAPR
jgi:cell division protein FtsB